MRLRLPYRRPCLPAWNDGPSDGGHIALYLAVNYSETFGLVGGQSSTITDLFRIPSSNRSKNSVEILSRCRHATISLSKSFRLLQLNREFRDLLLRKKYTVTYAEYHEGHSWGNWRAHTCDILKALYPYNSADVNVNKGVQ